MIEILTTALWMTLLSYIIFVAGRWVYVKFIKQSPDTFFYFLSLKKNSEGAWHVRIEAPTDDFELTIDLSAENEVIWTKNAHLKEGINSIFLFNEEDQNNVNCLLQISSSTQSLERKFIEAED